MQNSTRIFKFLLIALLLFTGPLVFGQSILNPTDTLVNYDTAHKPIVPNNGVIAKWVRTPRLSWNTTGYKAYIYNGNPFRLYFPKSYNPTANDGKKYPMLIFQHGVGEGGTVYDNEYQLFHGGDIFKAGVDNGTFDGYILCMQTTGSWGVNQFAAFKDIIDYMVANNKLDPFHVTGNGLSGGGAGTWAMYLAYPTYESGIVPMSGVDIAYKSSSIVNEVKYTPIWNIHGGQDGSPAPFTASQVADAMAAGGANYTDLNMTTQGHDTWDSTWSMPAFWPFMNKAYAANPWTLFGRTQFCPGDPINVTIGLCAGFQAYQWRKDSVIINGATSNTITATTTGRYDARIERGGIWSDWSHVPVVLSIKTPTITPPISVSGAMSNVLPGADGMTSVNLQVPDSGYTSYTWKKVGSDAVIGTQRILAVSQPGQYIVSVTQQFGCSSVYSPAFRVVNAAGPNAPSAATNLVSNALSFTQVELDWARNPNPVNPETGFEVYRSLGSGGPYTFAGLVPADTVRFVDQGLKPNVKYYYVVRAVDSTGAAALSNETSVVTQSDKTAPAAPANLKVVTTNQSSISLTWNSATDNVSVSKYFVYVNGAKSYIVTAPDTNFVVGGLDSSKQYSFAVTAADGSGNISVQSNQISAATVINGLTYSYYTTQNAWNVLPAFSTLTPVMTGNMPNVSIANATQASNYGYVWTGYIRIPVAGSYTFATSSDDGSAMWFNTLTPGSISTATVNNDGAHGTQQIISTAMTLQPGVYPVCYEFFQAGGGAVMGVSWACTALFGDNAQHTIADTYFASPFVPAGTAPAMPVQIHATATAYNRVNVTWVDSSNNESGFEVYRSVSSSGPYSIITTTAANVVSFTDSTVQPSTTYYYEVQAVNQYGASGFDPASLGGIQYSFYTNFTASNLSTLKTLTPALTGTLTNVSLSPATTTTNYAFKYQGTISIPTTGSYTFYTASDDGSDLYIGGFDSTHLVVRNDFLQGTTERSGVLTLAKGAYPIFVTYFQQGGGAALTASYQGPGITKQNIPAAAFVNTNSIATTLPLPATPSAPYQLVAWALSSSRTGLSWQDSSGTVTGFQVYRSVADTTHFVLLGTVAVNSYTDTALFANSTYYYKVNATGVGGNSAATAIVSVRTLDNLPVITKLSAQQVRYGTTVALPLSATHVGGGVLVYSGINLPGFAHLTDNHDGTASLAFSPAVTDQNTYPNLGVAVTDGFGGADTTIFSLVVNNSYAPVIDTVAAYSMNEGDSLSITLNSHEQNTSDTLAVAVSGVPAGYVLTPVSNGVAKLVLHPGFAASGVYTVQVKVTNNNGLSAVRTFGVTVKDRSPNTSIYAHVAYQDAVGLPWNSLLGTSTSNLLDSAGNTTTVGLNFSPSNWWTPL
ncbi:MAG TPA: PA14 domain-containing protein, partial [Puia sp.]